MRFGDQFGISMALDYRTEAPLDEAEARHRATVHFAVVTTLPATFAVLHLLLFAFHPSSRQNLYYAVFAACLAVLNCNVFRHDFVTDRDELIFYQRLMEIAISFVSLAAVRFVYAAFYDPLPKRFYFFLAGSLLVLLPWSGTLNTVSVFSLLMLAEMMRVMVAAALRKRSGSQILVAGGVVFFAACSAQLLSMLGVIPFLVENVYVYGVLALLASMSVYLAHQFAAISRSLGAANEQLTQHSQNLEKRVEERTRELTSKNDELENVLAELQGAQTQMVLQEKMASLGGLVSGIAHEINTPIGAIKSMHDTMSRAHKRLRNTLRRF